jgi:hypothetical protein
MNRSLTLLILIAAVLLLPAGAATAHTTSVKNVFAISGNSEFVETASNRYSVTDLRTGKVRNAKFPFAADVSETDFRVNAHAVAAVTATTENELQLSVSGAGIQPRLLSTLARPDPCGFLNTYNVLQIDAKDTVTAYRVFPTPDGGNPCANDHLYNSILRFPERGPAEVVELSREISPVLKSFVAGMSVRGDLLFIPPSGPTGEAIVYNLSSKIIEWRGLLPAANTWSMPADDEIWFSRDYLGHESRAYRFNFKTGKLVTIRVPHPRAPQPCGKFALFASGHRMEIYNQAGKVVKSMTLRPSIRFGNAANVCSANFAYVPRIGAKSLLVDLTTLR